MSDFSLTAHGIRTLVECPERVCVYVRMDPFRRDLVERHFQQSWGEMWMWLSLHEPALLPLCPRLGAKACTIVQAFDLSHRLYRFSVQPGRRYVASLVLRPPDEQPFLLMRSNEVTTPGVASEQAPVECNRPTETAPSQAVSGTLVYPYMDCFNGYSVNEGRLSTKHV